MKLSAVVLLSVNLVAASQVAANAADTASFLQDALEASPKAASAGALAKARPAQQTRKRSNKAYVAMTPVVDGVKLRPFMPGRYLPSEADLQAKKAEAAAQQAGTYSNVSGILAGQVSKDTSEMGSVIVPAAAYAMSRPANREYIQKVTQVAIQKVKQAAKRYSASRSIPGMNPVLPGQIAQLPGAPCAVPSIPEPRFAASMPVRVPSPAARSATRVPQVPQYNVASHVVVPSPTLTKYESSQLDRLVDENMPENVYSNSNGDMRTGQGNPGIAGGGSPPFPLSSLATGHGRGIHSTMGAQARFGSWHGGNSNLPQSSFQSYVPVHMAGPMAFKVNHYHPPHKTGRQAASVPSAHHASVAPAQHQAVAAKPKVETHVAAYAPYRKYSLF